MDFVYPKIKEDTKELRSELKTGVPLIVNEVKDKTNDAVEKAVVGVGGKLNDFVDLLGWLGKHTAGQTVLGGGITAGAMVGNSMLKNKSKKRMRDAERHRNEAYQRLHYQDATGKITPDQYSDQSNQIDKDTNRREKLRFSDYLAPLASLGIGVGGGALGYRHLTK
jgi:hypothetical protein